MQLALLAAVHLSYVYINYVYIKWRGDCVSSFFYN